MDEFEEKIGLAFIPPMPAHQAKQLNVLALAFMGDTIYDLYIRSHLIKTIHAGSHKLHVSAIKYVSAHEQALSLHDIEGLLTEDELYIYKRGRNAKPASVPKNADVGEYRTATGFEAVLGFLYVTGQYSRIDAIMQNVIAAKEKQDKPRKNNLEEEEVNVTISTE